MSGPRQAPGPVDDEARLAKDVLGDFLDDANEGQFDAIKGAFVRAVNGPKAAPLRALARDIDEANGNLFTRALGALLSHRKTTR